MTLVRMLKGEGRGGSGREAGGFEDRFELAGADHGVDFRNVFADFVAIALDEAAGDDELAGAALGFVAGHFEDGVDRLLLGGVDEGAGVDDEDLGLFGTGGEARAGAVEQAHHDLGIDEVFGAAEGDEAHGRSRGRGRFCLRLTHFLIVPGVRNREQVTGNREQGTANREVDTATILRQMRGFPKEQGDVVSRAA